MTLQNRAVMSKVCFTLNVAFMNMEEVKYVEMIHVFLQGKHSKSAFHREDLSV